MGQRTLDGREITALRGQYLRLVEKRLPAAAGAGWPIEDDRCFARVVLDTVFGGPWDEHVDGRPAYEHLSPAKLERAIETAEQLLAAGRPLVTARNEDSLRWRDEL